MINISTQQATEITSTIEDTVSYLAQSFAEDGEFISGETIYKIISAFATTKEAEFTGQFN